MSGQLVGFKIVLMRIVHKFYFFFPFRLLAPFMVYSPIYLDFLRVVMFLD